MGKWYTTLIILVVASQAWATPQIVVSSPSNAATTALAYYNGYGAKATLGGPGSNRYRCMMPHDGTLRRMRTRLETAPGGATKSRTETVYIDGGASSISTTCTDTEQVCFDNTNEEVVSKGSYFNYRNSTANTPASSVLSNVIEFDSNIPNRTFLCGSTGRLITGIPVDYLALSGEERIAGAAGIADIVLPVDAVSKSMYVNFADVPSGSDTLTATLTVNGSASSQTCSIDSSASSPYDCESTTEVPLNEDDEIYIKLQHSNPASVIPRTFGAISLEPNTRSGQVIATSNNQTVTANSSEYVQLAVASDGTTATESNVNMTTEQQLVITKIKCKADPGPTGFPYTVVCTLRQNGVDTGLSCSMSGLAGDTTCEDTDRIVIAEDDLVNTKITDDNSLIGATNQRVQVSYLTEIKGRRLWRTGSY